jgi:hypothetical protein
MMNGSVGRLVSDTRAEAVMAAEADKTPEAKVTSLYLSFLARRPTAPELAAATRSLGDGLAVTDLAWVLANTREFLFIR